MLFEQVLKSIRMLNCFLPSVKLHRFASVKFLIHHFGYSVIRRSEMGTESDDGSAHQIVILDTIGELGRLYSLADVVFVGGSFVRVGGHNILEPAAHGKPVLVGPFMFNFKEIFKLLSERGVCIMCNTPEDFEEELLALLAARQKMQKMGQVALEVVRENQGATGRNIAAFEKLLAEYHVQLKGHK